MSANVAAYQADILELLQDTAVKTEKQLGAAAAKKRVRYSNNSQKNFGTRVSRTAEGFQTEYIYRDTLRFTDGGMGKNRQSRKQKLFLGRTIMRNINRINDVVKGKTVTAALNTTKTLGNA
jgi:hypothetical protein